MTKKDRRVLNEVMGKSQGGEGNGERGMMREGEEMMGRGRR